MTHRWPKRVKLVEVGPRDGLQAESSTLSVEDRVALVNALSQTGLKSIEIGSFVSPKWVPQLAESGEVYQQIKKAEGVDYLVLVPNKQGFEDAKALGVKHIAIFTAATDMFANANINCTVEESYNRFCEFLPDARAAGMTVRGYVSCVVSCPFEGHVAPERVARVVENLLNLGCDEISLGDTTGVGTPGDIETLLDHLSAPREKLAVHFHNTYGQALANILVALENGIAVIDSSVSGLGGCPYAPGASGNVATEDVLYMLNGLGIKTGVDMGKVLEASQQIDDLLDRKTASAVGQAMSAE